ncbi:hypothetical protein QL285_031948 [Trifolium repens]|nr:hypothetical protein QL285_031948 [Trifolium repens]
MIKPFRRFLLTLKGNPKETKEEHKSDGCTTCIPNHLYISDQTARATVHVPKRCTSVSLSVGHHTQHGLAIKPGTPLRDKLTLVANLYMINCHENTITFESAKVNHWFFNTPKTNSQVSISGRKF